SRARRRPCSRRGSERGRASRSARCHAPDGRGDRPTRRPSRPPLALRTVAVARPFQAGERVLLVDAKRRRHLVVLVPGGPFHSHPGVLARDQVLGQEEGVSLRTSLGARFLALRPTLADYVLEMPRGAQVIYPKDLGPILILADVFPGARVLESGMGSGALTTA